MSGLWEDIKNAYFSYNGMGTNVFSLFVAIFYFLIINKKRQRNSSGDSGYPKMKQFQRNLKKQLEDLVSQMKNGEKGKHRSLDGLWNTKYSSCCWSCNDRLSDKHTH